MSIAKKKPLNVYYSELKQRIFHNDMVKQKIEKGIKLLSLNICFELDVDVVISWALDLLFVCSTSPTNIASYVVDVDGSSPRAAGSYMGSFLIARLEFLFTFMGEFNCNYLIVLVYY